MDPAKPDVEHRNHRPRWWVSGLDSDEKLECYVRANEGTIEKLAYMWACHAKSVTMMTLSLKGMPVMPAWPTLDPNVAKPISTYRAPSPVMLGSVAPHRRPAACNECRRTRTMRRERWCRGWGQWGATSWTALDVEADSSANYLMLKRDRARHTQQGAQALAGLPRVEDLYLPSNKNFVGRDGIKTEHYPEVERLLEGGQRSL